MASPRTRTSPPAFERLERGQDRTASVIEILVEDIDRLAGEIKQMKALPPVRRRKIGFHLGNDEDED
jgi:hypothetical protein